MGEAMGIKNALTMVNTEYVIELLNRYSVPLKLI